MANDSNADKNKDQKTLEAERERQREIVRRRQEEERKRQEAYEQKLIEEQRIAQERNNEKLTSKVPSVTAEGANGSYVTRDENGKVTETKDENGLVRKFTWDGENVTSFTDEKGKQWTSKDGTTWTAEGEKSRSMKVVVNAQDGSFAFVENAQKTETLLNAQKDGNNRISSATDANGVTRKFEYNDKGEVTNFTDGDGRTWSSKDGKTFESEGQRPRPINISVNQTDGTVSVVEAARLTMKMVDGKELVRSGSGAVLKDKDGKVIETISADESKRTKISYENGQMKSVTTPDGKVFTSAEGTSFTAPDGTTMRNLSVTDAGKMTYVAANGDVMQMAAPGQEPKVLTTRQALETSARNIAYAMNGGWTGAGTDRDTIKAELDKLSEPAREELKRVWTEMHNKGEVNFDCATLDEEFVDETSGSELEELRSKLNKKDGKEDVTGRVTTALTGLSEFWPDLDKPTYEKNIRELIGTIDSKSIQEYDKEYQSKNNGKSILQAVQESPNVSQTTKDAMAILIKGQDNRSDEDTIKLVDIALKGSNMDLLQETMRTASDKARQTLAADPTLQKRLETAFSIPDEYGGSTVDYNKVSTANDYLKNGRLGVATEIKLNTSAGGDNEKAIDTALNQMSEQERVNYQRGKQLATSGADPNALPEADKAALNTYKDIHDALNAAGYPWEVNRWESKITNSKEVASFIDQLYTHRGSIYNSSIQDVAKTVEDMPESVWKRLREEQKEGKTTLRDQIVAAYNSYEFTLDNEGKVKELTDILDKKTNAATFDEAKDSGRRDIFTALENSKGWLDDDETSGLKALQNMSTEEKRKYREDPEFRAKLDEAVKVFGRGVMDDAEYDAALKVLQRIDNKQSTDDVLIDLYTYAQETSVNEADVIRRVQEAFRKDPTLFEKIKNPTTPEEKQYAEEFKAILPKALGGWYDADYELFGQQLLETGHIDMFRSQFLNRGDFDDDEYGAYKSILYANKEETDKLINDKAYRDNVLWFLSEEERSVAVNNLKERDRQQNEIAETQRKIDSAATEEEKAGMKENLELQKKELDKLYSGEMRPEDDVYASMLGVGTDEDRLKNALARVPSEKMPQVLNDIAAKYNASLPAELVSELGGQDLSFSLRKIRPAGTSQQEDFVYSLDEYSNSRGFGAEFVRNAWDGTADQTDKEFNDFAAEISNAYRLGTEVPEEQRRERMERLAERIDNLVESKEALGNTVADVVIVAVAIVGTCFGQPETMGLLAFTSFAGALGLTGAALKVAIKQAIMGNNYSSEMMYADLATGFTDGAINAMGPGHIAALLSIGKKTASKSAVSITEKLIEKGLLRKAATTAAEETAEKTVLKGSKLVTVALENGTGQADNQVLKEVNVIVREAMTSGAEKLDDYAIKKAALRLVDDKIGQEAFDKALATGGKQAANEARKQAMADAADKIAAVMKESLIEEVKLSQSAVQRYVTNASFNAANGALAGGSSGSLYAATNFDSSKSLTENLEMIAKAGLTSAVIGGVMGGGMSTMMKFTSDNMSTMLRARNSESAAVVDTNVASKVRPDQETAAILREGDLTVSNKSAGSSANAYVLEAKIKTKQGEMDVVVDPIKDNLGEQRLAKEMQIKRIDSELGWDHAPVTESRMGVVDGVETRVRIQEKRGSDISEELYLLKDAREKELGRKLTVKELFDVDPEFKQQVEETLVERMIVGDVEMHTRNFTIDYPNGKPRFNNIDPEKAFGELPVPVLTHDYALNNSLLRVFADQPLSEKTIKHLKAFLAKHDSVEGRSALFSSHFTPDQTEALMARTRWLADNGKMPKTSSMYELAMMQVELEQRKAIERIFSVNPEMKRNYTSDLTESVEKARVQQKKMYDTEAAYETLSNVPNQKRKLEALESYQRATSEFAQGEITTLRPQLDARVADLQRIANAYQKANGLDEIPLVLDRELDHSGMVFKDGKIHVYVGSVATTAEESISQLKRALLAADADKRMKQVYRTQTLKSTVQALRSTDQIEAETALVDFMDQVLDDAEFRSTALGPNADKRWNAMISKADENAAVGSWTPDEIKQLEEMLESRVEMLDQQANSAANTAASTVPPSPPVQVVSAGNKRTIHIGNEQFNLVRDPRGDWFYPEGFSGVPDVSPVKLHINTKSPEDLLELQKALIPELYKDAELKSLVATWKTLDVNHGAGLKAAGEKPNGFGQNAKGFTIFVSSPADLERVAARLDEIMTQKKLSLPRQVDSRSLDANVGSSNRISAVRDRWTATKNAAGKDGYLIDDLIEDSIKSEIGIRGKSFTDEHLRYVETQTGLKKNSLALDKDGKLMLIANEKRSLQDGFYASDARSVTEFGEKTDRSALYSLYRHYNLDPVDVATGKVTKVQLRGKYSPISLFPFAQVGNRFESIQSLALMREKMGVEAIARELQIIERKYALATPEAREQLIDMLDDITSRWDNDLAGQSKWKAAISDFNRAAKELKETDPDFYDKLNAYLKDPPDNFIRMQPWYMRTNSTNQQAAIEIWDLYQSVRTASNGVAQKRAAELEKTVNQYLAKHGLPPTRIVLADDMGAAGGSWGNGIMTLLKNDVLGGRAEILSDVIGHELLHSEQTALIIRNLMDELNMGSKATLDEIKDLRGRLFLRLQGVDETRRPMLSHDYVSNVADARNGIRLTQEQRAVAVQMEREKSLLSQLTEDYQQPLKKAQHLKRYADALRSKSGLEQAEQMVNDLQSNNWQIPELNDSLILNRAIRDVQMLVESNQYSPEFARAILARALKKQIEEYYEEGMLQYSAYAGKMHEWDAYFHGMRVREVAEETDFTGKITDDANRLFEMENDPFAIGKDQDPLVASRPRPSLVSMSNKVEKFERDQVMGVKPLSKTADRFKSAIVRKQHGPEFIETIRGQNPLDQNPINTTDGNMNCAPCVLALFKTLLSDEITEAKRFGEVIYRGGQFKSMESIRDVFKQSLGMQTHSTGGVGYKELKPGHYALEFNMGPNDGHVVYLRKYDNGKIAVFDPQGHYYYDAFGLDEILKRKPTFVQATAPEGKTILDLPAPEEAIMSPEEITAGAAKTRKEAVERDLAYAESRANKTDKSPKVEKPDENAPRIRKIKETIEDLYPRELSRMKAQGGANKDFPEMLEDALEEIVSKLPPDEAEKYVKLIEELQTNDQIRRQFKNIVFG